ncbi:putative bifunctional diguanylate cyclase/phosphodiesterase [Devosia sp. SL43]|uniref:putative bifunctional diguanylate cyclase/phosphodiesterase n=1 Tax=Devosia sp. SL43 TaxID=2806348 RepID=UPI001F37B4CF|nr:EAL domain-containing protein [Devosia sp. SL43]UJW84253.1 EAL domain-containing protein [Devosia sp. SL43]
MIFEPAHRILPPVDYVSMIRSLYADRRSMLLGAFGSAIAAAVAALQAQSPLLGIFSVLFILVSLVRNADMLAFEKVKLADTDVRKAVHWEMRATIGAAAIAATYGTWCMVSFWMVRTPFAELTAASVSVSVLIGVSQRNFAVDRLMTIQVLLIGVPLAIGLLLVGDIYYALLTILLGPFFASLRQIAGNARQILLRAVHGRLAASALAGQLDTALATLEHGLLMLDYNGKIEVANARALDAFELPDSEGWVGHPATALFDVAVAKGSMPRAAHDQLLALIGARSSGKVLLSVRAGKYYEVSVSSRRSKTVLLLEDISERVIAEERISYMARYDALTGLPNRGYFAEQVEAALRERRETGEPGKAALWIVDIDDFKHINDTMGHLAGDQVLAALGRRLRDAFGPGTICARLGGDEFIAFRLDGASPESLVGAAEAVIGSMREPVAIPGRKFVVDISIGVVISDDLEDTLESLMVKADLAIYAAKADGKAKVVQFHDRMDTEYHMRQQLKADLKDAIFKGGLTLAYQAVIDPRQNRIVGCEALARWTHSVYGAISPATFIPIAEETGLITDLTRAVLMMATRDCQAWPGQTTVAVNVSARDFRAGDVEAMVIAALEASGLPPQRLEIEVTETAVIEEREAAYAALSSLCKRGVGVALDDFGTGYSSLSYLQALPLTKLKIDRSFVIDIENDPQALRLVANVAQLGKDLNLKITVEGVETEGQLNLLVAETRIDQIQGFVYGPPLSLEAMTRLLTAHHGSQVAPKLAIARR